LDGCKADEGEKKPLRSPVQRGGLVAAVAEAVNEGEQRDGEQAGIPVTRPDATPVDHREGQDQGEYRQAKCVHGLTVGGRTWRLLVRRSARVARVIIAVQGNCGLSGSGDDGPGKKVFPRSTEEIDDRLPILRIDLQL
jgi:hypothetical protein